MSYILPDFHMVDRILDKVERDNAEVVLIVPVWPYKSWWNRIHAGAWRARVGASEAIPPRMLEPYNEHRFFGSNFTTGLIIMRTIKL